MTRIILVCFLIGIFLSPYVQAKDEADSEGSTSRRQSDTKRQENAEAQDDEPEAIQKRADSREEDNAASRRADNVSVSVVQSYPEILKLFYNVI